MSDIDRSRAFEKELPACVIVTGVSRPRGIGSAIARCCAQRGATVLLSGFPAYDIAQAYPDCEADPAAQVARELVAEEYDVRSLPEFDFLDASAPAALFARAREEIGMVDGLVLNHAHSVPAPLGMWSAESIDRHLLVNVRASMLLLQEFANQLPESRCGAVVLLTSGQFLGPMVEEIAYAVSKEAIRSLCSHAAATLGQRRIRINAVNPGPTDTGYLNGAAWEAVRRKFPTGRWGTPEDAARLVAFLLSSEAAWITGQTISSEGGFTR